MVNFNWREEKRNKPIILTLNLASLNPMGVLGPQLLSLAAVREELSSFMPADEDVGSEGRTCLCLSFPECLLQV